MMPSSALSVLREIAAVDEALAARASHAVVVAVAMANHLGASEEATKALAHEVALGERDGATASNPLAGFARFVAAHGLAPEDAADELRAAYEGVRDLIQPLSR